MNKSQILLQALMGILGIAILGVGWHYTSEQADALIETNIVVYQQVELELARVTAHNFGGYIQNQDERDKALLVQDAYKNIVFPISLLESGYAWVYSSDYAVFRHEDLSPLDFSDKTIHEIFEMQRANGASHFDEVATSIAEASEGVGRYVWQAERGEEITAWAPIQIGDDVWVIGISTPLSEILAISGTTEQIKTMRRMAGVGAVFFLGMVLLVNSIGVKRQRTLTRLQASEERYRLLFNSAPDGVSILDKKGNILECSQSTAKLYGYSSPEQLVGKKLTELMSTDSLKVFREKMPLLQNLESAEGEIKIRRPDGSLVDIWRKGHPLTDAQGNFSGILSFDRDISERVQVESEFKKLHQAVEQSANSIVITDVDGAIEYVNPKFLQVSGYRESEILGENSHILKSGKHAQAHYENLWKTIKSGKEWHGEFCNKRKDNSLYWEKVTIAPVFDNEKKIINFIAVKEDITQQIYIEQELKKTYKNLEIQVKERTADLERANDLLEQRVVEINTLYQVMARATLSMHLDDILQHTLNAINETIKPDNIAILLIEEDTQDLIIRAYSGFGTGPKLMRRKLGVGIPGIVAQTGETIVLPDVRKHESYHACDDGALSEICVPLKIGEQVLGSLNLENQELDSFSEDDLRILIILANNLSIIIKNSQLYEDTLRLKEYSEDILFSVSEAIIFEDKDGYINFSNPAAETLLGYPLEEIEGLHWSNFFPALEQEKIKKEIKENDTRSYQSEIITKTKKVVPVIVSARSLYRKGKYHGTLATLIDITEREQVEKKLRESERRYRSFFENSPISLWEEDISNLLAYMDDIRNSGVKDIEAYFDEHPEEIIKCAELIEVLHKTHHVAHLKRFKSHSLNGVCRTA
jgi:PAS domain S-box-containing protein